MPLKRRMKETISLPIMQRYHRYLIRRSQVGLFQGKDCYDHYSQFTDAGHCVYDTHTKPSDFIDAEGLNAKVSAVLSGAPLRICYVGRAADMKGPFDWLSVMEYLRDSGVPFKAHWLGDGPLLQQMRTIVQDRNLSAHVDLAGFCSDRKVTLDTMKESHLFVFCHKTPESPRCLIESLVCGSPIVGYRSAYAADLVDPDGGGDFVDVGNVKALCEKLVGLHRNRPALAQAISAASRSGLRFDEEKLYRERANVIRSQAS
jgi:glycosyltransferase involved in cell wall biosynthesis